MKYKLEYELFSYISEFLIDFAYTVMICAVIFCAQIMITPPVRRHFGPNVGRGYIDFFTSEASAEERGAHVKILPPASRFLWAALAG